MLLILMFSGLTAKAQLAQEEKPSYCSQLKELQKSSKWSYQNPTGAEVETVVVDKGRRLMHLIAEDKVVRTFKIALGTTPKGAKRCEGDNKTPEGKYFIEYKNSASSYHMALKISYPSQDDINRSRKLGCNPGGDIMIHGLPNSGIKRWWVKKNHPKDWTKGCVAVTDSEIEQIYDVVDRNTEVELCP